MEDLTKSHNVVFYLRASTKKQPVARQNADLTKFANGMGWNIIDIFPENESGLLDAKDRPELTRMMEFVKNPKNGITCVAVHELSRLGRNKDVLNIVSELTALGINLYARKESLNTFNEDGTKNGTAKMVIGILSAINENEVETAQYRFSSGKKYWASVGAVAGGFLPIGYKSSDDIKHRVIIKDEDGGAALVRRVFDMYLRGNRGCRAIASVFNDEGIPTQQKEKLNNKWLQTGIRSILLQSMYVGKRKHKGEVFELPQLRIISDEDFAAAGIKLSDNSFKQVLGNKQNYLLDRKIITCGVCKSPYHARNNHSSRTYIYSCASARNTKGSCGNVGINIKKLDAAVLYNVEKYFPAQVVEQLDYQYFIQQIELKKNQILDLELEQELFESKMERLNDIYAAGGSKAKWEEKLQALKLANVQSSLKQTKLSAEITSLEFQMNEPEYQELTKEVLHKVIQSITIRRAEEIEHRLKTKGDKAVKVTMVVRGRECSFYLSHFSTMNELVEL